MGVGWGVEAGWVGWDGAGEVCEGGGREDLRRRRGLEMQSSGAV